MKRHNKITFKPCENTQGLLFPSYLDEEIPENHLVRVVNSIIDKMNLNPILKTYKGGGRSSYHPGMLLKVIVYAYTQKIYSSRQIAKALRENLYFMWLSGKSFPDFRTINRFRSSRLKKIIDKVFSSLIEILADNNLINLKDYFLDGTKLEANANKYSFVWKKSTERYKKSLQQKVKQLLENIEKCEEEENKRYGDKDLEELGEDSLLDSKKLEKKVQELNEILKKNPKINL